MQRAKLNSQTQRVLCFPASKDSSGSPSTTTPIFKGQSEPHISTERLGLTLVETELTFHDSR